MIYIFDGKQKLIVPLNENKFNQDRFLDNIDEPDFSLSENTIEKARNIIPAIVFSLSEELEIDAMQIFIPDCERLQGTVTTVHDHFWSHNHIY